MMRLNRFTLAMAVAASLVSVAFYAPSAAAQATAPSPTPPPAGGDQGSQGAAPPSGGGTAPPQGGATTTTTTVTPYGMPPASYKGPVGGGNATESSAHPVIGEEEDSFDLGAAGTRPEMFHTMLSSIFTDDGAMVLERQIVKQLCEMVGERFAEMPGYTLRSYFESARRAYESQCTAG